MGSTHADDGRLSTAELARYLNITEDEAIEVQARVERDARRKAEIVDLAAEVGFKHGWIEPSGDWVSVPKASLLDLLHRVRDLEAATGDDWRHDSDSQSVAVTDAPLESKSTGRYLVVSTAAPTREDAVRLAGSAVRRGLAAGAQIVGPVVSVYWHAGEYGEGEEWQVLFKTPATRYSELEAVLLAEHPWESPEIGATRIVAGAARYLRWLDRSTANE